jgi:hypothetical protein
VTQVHKGLLKKAKDLAVKPRKDHEHQTKSVLLRILSMPQKISKENNRKEFQDPGSQSLKRYLDTHLFHSKDRKEDPSGVDLEPANLETRKDLALAKLQKSRKGLAGLLQVKHVVETSHARGRVQATGTGDKVWQWDGVKWSEELTKSTKLHKSSQEVSTCHSTH